MLLNLGKTAPILVFAISLLSTSIFFCLIFYLIRFPQNFQFAIFSTSHRHTHTHSFIFCNFSGNLENKEDRCVYKVCYFNSTKISNIKSINFVFEHNLKGNLVGFQQLFFFSLSIKPLPCIIWPLRGKKDHISLARLGDIVQNISLCSWHSFSLDLLKLILLLQQNSSRIVACHLDFI